jgi:hypothetical protein
MSIWDSLKTLVSALFLTFVLTACSSSSGPDNSSAISPQIERVYWYMENIDQSYWSTFRDQSAYINFSIHFKQSNLTASDIESIVVTAPTGRTWIDDDAAHIEANFDPQIPKYTGMSRLYSTYYSPNASVLPIGNYKFDVTYTSGEVASFTLLVPEPGSTGTGSVSYTYTEDFVYASNPPDGYTELPLRATINSALLDTTTSQLSVDFSINDPKVYSGYIWLYNASGTYIGRSEQFRNFASGIVSTTVNLGATLMNDGTANSVVLLDRHIEFNSGYSMNDIYSLHLVLTDGIQYAADDRSFDTRSISAKSFVTVQ